MRMAVESNDASTHAEMEEPEKTPQGRFPHIKDLQMKAEAVARGYSPQTPLRRLLDEAENAAKRVNTDVSFKRQDRAYVEYIVYSEILLNIIPRSKDFITIGKDRIEWQRRYKSLQKQNDAQNAMFKQIYNAIIEDNRKSGAVPLILQNDGKVVSGKLTKKPQHRVKPPRPNSMPPSPHDLDHLLRPTVTLPDPKDTQTMAVRASTPSDVIVGKSIRPSIRPKPPGLLVHGLRNSAVISSDHDEDLIASRFSQLRVSREDLSLTNTSSNGVEVDLRGSGSAADRMPDDRWERNHIPTTDVPDRSLSSPTRPTGPRTMPGTNRVPALPPKLPLTPSSEHLPKAPLPAYDPNKASSAAIDRRGREASRQLTTTSVPDMTGASNRWSGKHQLPDGIATPARSSSTKPKTSKISAAELYERFQDSNVLVIDVRSRDQYDFGHIFAKSSMCVEPVGIRFGCSAEDLQDRLVVSPDAEQILFDRRHEFDFVVYHDLKTASDKFLQGPPDRTQADHLRAIHDTLYEFNDYKALRNPPLLLVGGLEAWTDLVGPQALATSKTAALIASDHKDRLPRRSLRPLGRNQMANANSSLEVRKRRLKEQNSLNPDEERRWLESARKDKVNIVDYEPTHADEEGNPHVDEPPSPFIQSYEDYLRRFPEVLPMAQSMTTVQSRLSSGQLPPPPPLPPSSRPISGIPAAPPLPPSVPFSSYPDIPSRPPAVVPRPSYSGVTDIESSQFSPTSRQNSASQHPLYTSRTASHFWKLPRTGLVNFGVTCYMNATIQCLLATIPLSQFFLDNRWRDLTQKNWKGSNGILPEIFANLIRHLWKNDVTAVRPSSLRAFCARLNDEWGADRQQDAKEFFDFIVDCLHEDLNINFERTPLRPLTFPQEMQREKMPVGQVSEMEWDRYCHREKSFISDLFAGQHASRLRCKTCKNTSTTHEAFYSISIEIPRQDRKKGWTLDDCLHSYCQEEMLSGEEVWKCPYCKCEREATKKILITRAPQFLVVHFKRFEMRKGDTKKVHTPINFPLFNLNLGEYMIQPDTKQALHTEDHIDVATRGPFIYDAYAVMRHIGTSGNGGHYVSLVRDSVRGCWRRFDDDKVTDFDPTKLKSSQRLQNEEAYLVFYGRAAAR